MNIVSLHATHQAVALADLERLAGVGADVLLRDLAADPAIHEAVVLSTCNRFEVYLAAPDPHAAHAAAFTILSARLAGGIPHGIFLKRGLDSASHLLRVASGLESLIVGEDQILGQVREAYRAAQEAATAGPALTLLFERALAIGKRVRARTRVNEGAVSVGSAAVDLAERILGDLDRRRFLVVGAGEMAELVARSLAARGLPATVVAHRNVARAQDLARLLGGDAATFPELRERVRTSDVVVTATSSPTPILSAADLAGIDRPILLIDISNPRNVAEDVRGVPHARLENLDGLKRLAEENLARRRKEAEAASKIVEEEIRRIAARLESGRAEATLGELHARAQSVRDEEVAKALRKLALDERQRKILDDLAGAVAKRLLAETTETLRAAARRGDERAVDAVRQAFGLGEPAPPRAVKPRSRRRG